MNKSVRFLIPAETIDMGGFPVKQSLPTQNVQQVDPFLLVHHARTLYSNRRPAKQQGVGPHPHRGFSPVTFVVEGEVHHRDSRGHDQVAKKGEVQWMHAGMGIIHSERPSQNLVETTRRQEIVQMWINSPAAKKMNQPEYHYASNDNMVLFSSTDGLVQHKLVAGNYGDRKGAIQPQSELFVIWANGSENGETSFTIPEGYNAMIYNVRGKFTIKGYGMVEAEQLAVMTKEGSEITISIQEADTQFILLAGKPLDEKVTQHGPFVMNDQTEILEAMRDYQMGKMGILIED